MTPSRLYSHLRVRLPKKVTRGLDSWLDHGYGLWKRRTQLQKTYHRQAHQLAREADCLRQLDDATLADRLKEHQRQLRRKRKTSTADAATALPFVAIAAERTLGLSPHPVQFMATLVLIDGKLAEMATGEGKTLSTSMAATVLGWSGHPVHILTSNDYLAQRDAEEMEPLYQSCHLSVGFVTSQMGADERRQNYARDIVCTTSKELLADFLRDRLTYPGINDPARLLARDLLGKNNGQPSRVLRGLHTALVDEADSILIDEAVNPLIISQKVKQQVFIEGCRVAATISQALQPGRHYRVRFQNRQVHLTSTGRSEIEAQATAFPKIWHSAKRSAELVQMALQARECYLRDRDYIVRDNKVVIVDPNTGRQKNDSLWRSGLHQAIEIKEGVPVSDAAKPLASMTFQGFFRLFDHLGATTGTAAGAANEFWHVYRLPVIRIPTHRRVRRHLERPRYLATQADKLHAITQRVTQLHQQGRPILVGTNSVETSDQLAGFFREAGLQFELLNAREHAREAAVIARGGERGAITIATNMAGRGTDIKLGPDVADLGGLFVIATDRMESKRVDRQLYGRSARQGDPGSAAAYISLEDNLLQQVYPKTFLAPCAQALKMALPGSHAMAAYLVNKAQRKVEHRHRKNRQAIMANDHWLRESLAFSGSQQL